MLEGKGIGIIGRAVVGERRIGGFRPGQRVGDAGIVQPAPSHVPMIGADAGEAPGDLAHEGPGQKGRGMAGAGAARRDGMRLGPRHVRVGRDALDRLRKKNDKPGENMIERARQHGRILDSRLPRARHLRANPLLRRRGLVAPRAENGETRRATGQQRAEHRGLADHAIEKSMQGSVACRRIGRGDPLEANDQIERVVARRRHRGLRAGREQGRGSAVDASLQREKDRRSRQGRRASRRERHVVAGCPQPVGQPRVPDAGKRHVDQQLEPAARQRPCRVQQSASPAIRLDPILSDNGLGFAMAGRSHPFVPLAVFWLAFASPAVAADGGVLTCDQFRQRLDRTIRDMGDRVAPPGALKPSYAGGDSGKRFDWDGIVGLSGTMNCSKRDAFEDFGIAIAEATRTSDDLPVVLQRFMELASASTCALADATPDACRALVKTMTLGSLAQFRDAAGKGDAMPTGTRDFFIVEGVDAELDMTPVGITWSIGPGLSMTTSATPQKLAPKNADE